MYVPATQLRVNGQYWQYLVTGYMRVAPSQYACMICYKFSRSVGYERSFHDGVCLSLIRGRTGALIRIMTFRQETSEVENDGMAGG